MGENVHKAFSSEYYMYYTYLVFEDSFLMSSVLNIELCGR